MKIVAIVGSYRRGGVVESAVDELLAAAEERGAAVEKVHLLDRRVDFCSNCRACTLEPGPDRGACPMADDMPAILDALEACDGIVLASPVNFGTVTALMKRFVERTVCHAYWPWGDSPRPRQSPRRRAVVVVATAAPAWLARWGSDAARLLRKTARLLGAEPTETLRIGLARQNPDAVLADTARARARAIGRRLAAA